MSRHVLVARQDSVGDVLLAGPAVRAVAARAGRVTLLCGPRGREAAKLLPGVDQVVVEHAAWIDAQPERVTRKAMDSLVDRLTDLDLDQAVILTSFHQSPLPLALLLRMAEMPWIGAICEDYPGSLLDLRHRVPPDLPESERSLSLAIAAGFAPDGLGARLAVRGPLPDVTARVGTEPYVVVHPGAAVPARRPTAGHSRDIVAALVAAGNRVVVTGSAGEATLSGFVANGKACDLGGQLSLRELAAVLRGADVVVVPNTGPAHLAAAVDTPVVSLFAPVVSSQQWAPYGVPRVVLGDQEAPCRDTRMRTCTVPGHPCLTSIRPHEVVTAVKQLREQYEPDAARRPGALQQAQGA